MSLLLKIVFHCQLMPNYESLLSNLHLDVNWVKYWIVC